MQLITPNPNIPCTPGWCLQYVRQTFGLPARYGSATEAWEKSKSRHTDQNFPADLWVPVWFTIDTEPNGHVALRAPNGNVYSSSDLGSVPHLHPDIADLIAYYAYWGKMQVTYLGWTEDVAGYPVVDLSDTINPQGTITPIQEEPVTPDDIKAIAREVWAYNNGQSKDAYQFLLDAPGSTAFAVWGYTNPGLGTADAYQILRDAVANTGTIAQEIAAAAAKSAATGATEEQIKAAVIDALKAGVNVNVTVGGK